MSSVRNLITFKGTKEALDEVIAFLKRDGDWELNFNVFVPSPEGLMFEDFDPYEGAALGEFLVDHTTYLMGKRAGELTYGDTTVRDTICSKLTNVPYDLERLRDEDILLAFKEKLEEKPWRIKEAKRAYENYKKYGYSSMQEWAKEYWSTPSNAYCCELLSKLKPKYDEEEKCYSMSYGFKTKENAPGLVYMAMAKKFPDVRMQFEFSENVYGKGAGYIQVYPEDNKAYTVWVRGSFMAEAQAIAKKVYRVKEKK